MNYTWIFHRIYICCASQLPQKVLWTFRTNQYKLVGQEPLSKWMNMLLENANKNMATMSTLSRVLVGLKLIWQTERRKFFVAGVPAHAGQTLWTYSKSTLEKVRSFVSDGWKGSLQKFQRSSQTTYKYYGSNEGRGLKRKIPAHNFATGSRASRVPTLRNVAETKCWPALGSCSIEALQNFVHVHFAKSFSNPYSTDVIVYGKYKGIADRIEDQQIKEHKKSRARQLRLPKVTITGLSITLCQWSSSTC